MNPNASVGGDRGLGYEIGHGAGDDDLYPVDDDVADCNYVIESGRLVARIELAVVADVLPKPVVVLSC